MNAPTGPPRQAYQEWVHSQVPSARAPIAPPATLEGWDRRLTQVRAGLQRSFGRFPDEPCDLAPEVLGVVARDGYAIERLTIQARPGVRITANLYRPAPAPARAAAVLSVHGHWAWARIDPHVQARCIGLAKLGYVCLCVDAFGAGERAVAPGPGTYHGGLLGASLWPSGTPLLGLQVYDNRRAVDYLVTRPEVDPKALAITGASGGGNQTLYAGATDDRFAAVIPVCGIGTYEAYLQTACCVCEVNVGGLTYATTGDVLALVAPRALLVVNATNDGIQFSVGAAKKSLDYARERFRLLNAVDKVRQTVIESGHDYNQPMREALYGWLDRWLRGRGDGGPVPEPKLDLEDPATLRCYPDGPSRPKTIMTIPEFAFQEGTARLAALPPPPDHPQRWEADAEGMRATLRDRVLGGFPRRVPLDLTRPDGAGSLEITTEPGLRLRGATRVEPVGLETVALVLRPGGRDDPAGLDVKDVAKAGFSPVEVDLRALGRGKPETGAVAGVADHHESEWGLWIGRPLLGQWVWDVVRWLDALDALRTRAEKLSAQPYTLIGIGSMSVVALVAAALDSRIGTVALADGLARFVGPGPWARLPMGIIAPNLLDVGDVGHLAALCAPRRLVVAGGVGPSGAVAAADELDAAFAFTRQVYRVLNAEQRLTVTTTGKLPALLSPSGGGP